ncbi:MATE family efflux transporter [Pseudoblastomonas halimionae]|uniref:MATE family efflux transporter n=1 Tax=Alteriqipengyuania halimionae TaxID=1926630 RepID=A0A6I4U574_9SPHN|nr:MATE family efflux transporter [Alteriqipengyuania halimionae]MXP11138.1 MATE family efflux transporter [Alteriqipengyuania halimionae]
MPNGDTSDEPSSARLTRGSIRGHLVSQTAPMIVGIAAIMSIGIVDAYFIGQLGAAQLAAVAFIFPVTQALSSLGVGVMAGIASVVSRALGRGEDRHAEGLANLGFVLAAGVGIVLALALYALRQPLFELMQADDNLLPMIDAYMGPYAIGFFALPFMMAVNGALRAQGAAKRSMAVLITMAATNWVLDPILITGGFGFEGFGIAGAAYATLASWVIAATVGFTLLQTSDIRFAPSAIRHCMVKRDAGALSRVAVPSAFANSINPVGLSILTALLASAGQDAVAGFGAAGRLQAFATVPLLGLSSSIGAIVGQNWGAGQVGRARSALVQSFAFSLVWGLSVAALLVFFRSDFAAMFADDGAVKDSFERYVLIAAWGYAGFGMFIVGNGALNAIDHAAWALGQSIVRVVLFMIPVAWLLRSAWGEDAIYAAELSANVLGGALAVAVALWFVREGRANATS